MTTSRTEQGGSTDRTDGDEGWSRHDIVILVGALARPLRHAHCQQQNPGRRYRFGFVLVLTGD